ncbi:MAG: ribonuclease III [Lachnospiraceae bacterium]|nr:ribonuclease III [Lachnospiraceae bacterium]
MAEANNLYDEIKASFGLNDTEPEQVAPLILAHLGDCVYEIVVRTVIDTRTNRQINKIHNEIIKYVSAGAQSKIITALIPELTEEELAIFHKGKNTHTNSFPKNGTKADYHRATGFEALVGYLYLKGRTERMLELVKKGMESISE